MPRRVKVIFFNKKQFAQAGLPADRQPRSWDDILAAGTAPKKVGGVEPIQVNAGPPMREVCAAQGFLPVLAGTGKPLFDEASDKRQGATSNVTAVLDCWTKIRQIGMPRERFHRPASTFGAVDVGEHSVRAVLLAADEPELVSTAWLAPAPGRALLLRGDGELVGS